MKKQELLPILSSDRCPICDAPKEAHTWACRDCYNPHLGSPEAQQLSHDCDRHMASADAFLTMLRTLHPQSL